MCSISHLVQYLPVNGQLPLGLQQLVRPAKVPAPEEPSVGRQTRGVRAGQHVMSFRIDQLSFILRILTPQQKHHPLPLFINHPHRVSSKLFPPPFAMACSSMRFDCQHSVQKQHSLQFMAVVVLLLLCTPCYLRSSCCYCDSSANENNNTNNSSRANHCYLFIISKHT